MVNTENATVELALHILSEEKEESLRSLCVQVLEHENLLILDEESRLTEFLDREQLYLCTYPVSTIMRFLKDEVRKHADENELFKIKKSVEYACEHIAEEATGIIKGLTYFNDMMMETLEEIGFGERLSGLDGEEHVLYFEGKTFYAYKW